MTSSYSSSSPPEDLEWEEWDSQTSPLSFFHHCLAGSFAGVAEHTLLYPLDTVKTCWQSQVLHRAASGGGVISGCTAAVANGGAGSSSSSSCGFFAAESIARNTSNIQMNPTTGSGMSTTTTIVPSSKIEPQGIWSTMKHLMQLGHHHHHQPPLHFSFQGGGANNNNISSIQQLAGNPPNVVDLTTVTTKKKNVSNHPNLHPASSTLSNESAIKRPWSKQGRILRKATLHDITSQGMIHVNNYNSSIAGTQMLHPSAIVTLTNNIGSTSGSVAGTITMSNPTPPHAGFKRLWRGVQSMFVGCIPAHALYFSSYELIKSICTDGGGIGAQQYNHDQNQRTPQLCHSSQQDHMIDDNISSSSMSQHPLHETKLPPLQNDAVENFNQGGHVGHDTLSPTQAMVAGGVATLLHDFVMTPMDTMKQRMQLGHYDNLRHAFVSIVWGGTDGGGITNRGNGTFSGGEGWKGLYRSFPITVMTNVPYGMIMMATNEWLRGILEDGLYGTHQSHNKEDTNHPFHFTTIMLSGMGAGAFASATTAPLDRVKTRLQTQRMGMALPSHFTTASPTMAARGIMEERALAAAQGNPKVCPKMAMQDVKSALFPSSAAASKSAPALLPQSLQPSNPFQTYYSTPYEAFQSIVHEEGVRGLFRGTLPRVALHAPSVAISWTAYEMAKDWLLWSQQ